MRDVGVFLILSLVATPCWAQVDPSAEEEADKDIVVTGIPLTRAEARRQAAAFIRGVGVAQNGRPVARWKDPVCPRVVGLQPAHASMVESRLRAIAREAGVPVAAKATCRANIAVSFVDGAAPVAKSDEARQLRSLAKMDAEERARLIEGRAPIRWRYTTALRGRDNEPPAPSPATWAGNVEGGGSAIPDTGGSVQSYGSSIVSTMAIRVITSAAVVVDVKQAEGRNLETAADYAALVAFAEIGGDGYAPQGSILGAFEPGGIKSLSEWDRRFLRTLYRLPLDRQARLQRYRIINELASASPPR
ncbi:hypothetical protein [Sphingomonas sp. Y38-1Y]|uniref:hypothetical protein n=1 Tax=Sphingomonas sp. Y38-1Y TaxID=3078265 RepID=UPI0028EBC442|nr:hypothetical protein [Sphingomonas sp. Y38-1Y]